MEKDLFFTIAEEINKKREQRWYDRPLNMTRVDQGEHNVLVQQMQVTDDERHFSYFRISVSCFDNLVYCIMPFIQHASTHSMSISTQARLAVTLQVLASGNSQDSVAVSYKKEFTTVCLVISEVTKAIWLAFPLPAQMVDIAQDFWRLWDFPSCVGASMENIKIKAPSRAGNDLNGQHSIVLIAVRDARYKYGIESNGGT